MAATNRDLEEEAEQGRFRSDLLYRLNVHQIVVPSLRDHLSDVPELVDHFLELTCHRFRVRLKTIAPEVTEKLTRHRWERNNVRELRNAVERLVIASDGDRIEVKDLPAGSLPGRTAKSVATDSTFQERKRFAEKEIIEEALNRNDWHITRTAQALGLADHSSLIKIMRRHGLRK